jgi:flagellar hook-associated protein 3 FlgL
VGTKVQLQSQLSSGKRLTRPADDPPAVERALTYRAAVAAGEQYLETMERSLGWLAATDDALGTAAEILQRANELAVQGANGALGQSQMQGLAAEVNQLVEHLVTVGNATLRGQRDQPFGLLPRDPPQGFHSRAVVVRSTLTY